LGEVDHGRDVEWALLENKPSGKRDAAGVEIPSISLAAGKGLEVPGYAWSWRGRVFKNCK